MDQNKDAPILTRANVDFFLGSSLKPLLGSTYSLDPDCLGVRPSDPEFAALLLSHANLPPAYIQVSGLDPLRDEGLLYATQLRESDVKTRLDVCVASAMVVC